MSIFFTAKYTVSNLKNITCSHFFYASPCKDMYTQSRFIFDFRINYHHFLKFCPNYLAGKSKLLSRNLSK